jgi:hypothetical protein
MLLGAPKAKRWRGIGLALTVLAMALFWWQGRIEPFRHGGSAWGLGWGILGLVLILLLAAFGIRKRAYKSTLGTLEGWLQAHLVLGLLSLLVVLFHTGFRFEDKLAVATLVVMAVVVGSGLLGVLLYSVVPRRLTEVKSNRTAAEISTQLNQLIGAMESAAQGRSASFERLARELVRSARPPAFSGWRLLFAGRSFAAAEADPAWKPLLAQVPTAERDPLRQLLVLYRQHRELASSLVVEQYYRNWLDAWLFVHLPLSLALLVLLVAHVITALYFRGI